jgi:U3 small nucleolar RNA-associated protein 11
MFCFPAVAMLVVAVTCVSGLLILFLNDRQTRKKFGLLEKHKDYVDRAKAFHKKEEALRVRIGLESYILIC